MAIFFVKMLSHLHQVLSKCVPRWCGRFILIYISIVWLMTESYSKIQQTRTIFPKYFYNKWDGWICKALALLYHVVSLNGPKINGSSWSSLAAFSASMAPTELDIILFLLSKKRIISSQDNCVRKRVPQLKVGVPAKTILSSSRRGCFLKLFGSDRSLGCIYVCLSFFFSLKFRLLLCCKVL